MISNPVKFEKFRPRLKAGKLTPQGDKVIFEIESPLDQVILPLDVIDFLLQCNGQYTVGEIIESIYHRKGNIQFKSIYKTLSYLKERGFIENGDELDLPTQTVTGTDTTPFLTFRPLFEMSISNRIFNESEKPHAFYLFSMIAIVGAILSLQHADHDWLSFHFLKTGGSYWSGILYVFFTSSILLTAKNLFKCLLLLFLTGRAYNFSLVFNGFALYFRVKSDSLFLVNDRLYLFLFHLATLTCFFPLIGSAHFFFPDLPHLKETMSLAFLLFLFDLNPFQESESQSILKSVFNDDTVNKLAKYLKGKSLLSILHPNERNRDHGLYTAYTYVSLAWACLIIYITTHTIQLQFGLLFANIKNGHTIERLSALATCSYLLTLTFVTSYNAYRVALASIFDPLWRKAKHELERHQQSTHHQFNNNEVRAIVEHLPLFSYFNTELLDMIVQRSALKSYERGHTVIRQGDLGTHLFVLLKGHLAVSKRLQNGTSRELSQILPPTVFGEVAVIDNSPRTADVIAKDNSVALEIPAPMLRQMAEGSQYVRELDSFRNAIMVNQFFSSAPIFRELSEEVVRLFIFKGKIEAFVPNQVIFRQGDNGHGFYLLLRGSVGVTVNGRPVARIQQGGFFGEISMITDVPRTATVFAQEPTQVLKIGRDAFWEILAQDINMAMFIESVGEMRIREDIEILKSGSARVA